MKILKKKTRKPAKSAAATPAAPTTSSTEPKRILTTSQRPSKQNSPATAAKSAKKRRFSLSFIKNLTKKQKIIAIAGGAVLVIGIGFGVGMLFNSTPKDSGSQQTAAAKSAAQTAQSADALQINSPQDLDTAKDILKDAVLDDASTIANIQQQKTN